MIKATTRQKYMSSNSKLHVLTGQELTPELLMLCSVSLIDISWCSFGQAHRRGSPHCPVRAGKHRGLSALPKQHSSKCWVTGRD